MITIKLVSRIKRLSFMRALRFILAIRRRSSHLFFVPFEFVLDRYTSPESDTTIPNSYLEGMGDYPASHRAASFA